MILECEINSELSSPVRHASRQTYGLDKYAVEISMLKRVFNLAEKNFEDYLASVCLIAAKIVLSSSELPDGYYPLDYE